MKKVLIAYYSRSGANYVNGTVKHLSVGNTRFAAGFLNKLADADLFRIEPVYDYPDDYYACIDRARQDLIRKARPDLCQWPDSIAAYQSVYLGYPNYWGTMPMPVYSFLEKYDWHGIAVYPFCTHEGGGLGRSEEELRKICRGAAVAPGLAIRGADVPYELTALKEWYFETLKGSRKERETYV